MFSLEKTYYNVTDKLYHIELHQIHLTVDGNQTQDYGGDSH